MLECSFGSHVVALRLQRSKIKSGRATPVMEMNSCGPHHCSVGSIADDDSLTIRWVASLISSIRSSTWFNISNNSFLCDTSSFRSCSRVAYSRRRREHASHTSRPCTSLSSWTEYVAPHCSQTVCCQAIVWRSAGGGPRIAQQGCTEQAVVVASWCCCSCCQCC